MIRSLSATALLLPLFAFACDSHHIKYSKGYVRATAPGQPVAAAYMKIKNTGDESITIKSISSPDADQVAIHMNMEQNNVVKMTHLETLEIPAHKTVVLKPGIDQTHIMLMGLKKPLVKGDKVTLTFTYEDDSTSEIYNIPVKNK